MSGQYPGSCLGQRFVGPGGTARRHGSSWSQQRRCTQDRAIEGNTNCQCKQRALFSRPLIARRSRRRQPRFCAPALSRSGRTLASSSPHSPPRTGYLAVASRRVRSRWPAVPPLWRSSCAASAWPAGMWSSRPTRSSPPRRRQCAAGARPVFADIDPATFALSPETVAAVLTPQTAAVLLVHIGGLISPQAAELRQLCAERGIALVEDAAHAHGCTYAGEPAGCLRRGRGLLVLPDQGRDVRRGRDDPHAVGGDRARGADLPRPGQGQHERQSPRPARVRVADERAGRRHRPGAPAPTGRVHRAPSRGRGPL